jgi:hypothetical protein
VKVAVSMEEGAWPQIDVRAPMALLDPSVKEVRVFKSFVERHSSGLSIC